MRSFDLVAPKSSPGTRTHNYLAAGFVAASLLAGCAAGPSPAASPAPNAPQLIMTSRGLKQWDHPEAFGPVPAELLATGRQYCATLNNGGKRYSPTGYHPHARSVEGFAFEDGGFYCTLE
ncbi:MAG: hypothetical protein ACTS6O_12030 [Giesbergeria sp.]